MPALRENLRTLTGGLPRPFWALWAGTFITRCGNFVLPFLTLYLTRERHLSLSQAGLIVALFGAGGSVAGPLGGFLADRIGRRATLLLALGLGGVGMASIGFIDRLELLAPAIFCVAAVTEMYRPAMQAAVADLVPSSDRVRAFGLIYWVINLGFAVGLTLGGLLARVSFRLLFVGDGVTTLLFALVIWLAVPESRPARAPLAAGARRASQWSEFFAPYRDRPFAVFFALNFLFALVFMQSFGTLPLAMSANGISTATYGLVMAINGVLIVVAQPFLAPALTRRNRSHTIATYGVLVGLGFGLNALAHTAPIYAIGVLVWTVGEIGVLPVSNALVADLAPPHIRGRYQGAYSMAWGLAVCAAPALGTFVLQRFGAVTLWSGCLVLALAISAGHLALAPALTRLRAQRIGAAAGH